MFLLTLRLLPPLCFLLPLLPLQVHYFFIYNFLHISLNFLKSSIFIVTATQTRDSIFHRSVGARMAVRVAKAAARGRAVRRAPGTGRGLIADMLMAPVQAAVPSTAAAEPVATILVTPPNLVSDYLANHALPAGSALARERILPTTGLVRPVSTDYQKKVYFLKHTKH